jgi:hypothetical protein
VYELLTESQAESRFLEGLLKSIVLVLKDSQMLQKRDVIVPSCQSSLEANPLTTNEDYVRRWPNKLRKSAMHFLTRTTTDFQIKIKTQSLAMKRSYSQQSSPPPQASTSALLLPTKKTKKVRSTTATPLASSPPGGSPPYVPSNLNVVTTGMSPARDRSRSRSASASVFSKGPGEGSRKAGSVASGAGVKKKKVRVSKGKGKQKEREGTVSTPALTLETSNQPSISGAPSARSNDDDAEVEEEDLEYSDDEFGADKRANERMKEELRVLMGHFDENQMDRYESFRRSGLAKGSVRKVWFSLSTFSWRLN